MSTSRQTPAELAAWVEERVRILEQLAGEVRQITDHDREDVAAWTMHLLEELSNVESLSRRMVHLLTAFAIRNRIASPTETAKASHVTITGAQSRAASALAQDAWNEVWPSPGA